MPPVPGKPVSGPTRRPLTTPPPPPAKKPPTGPVPHLQPDGNRATAMWATDGADKVVAPKQGTEPFVGRFHAAAAARRRGPR